MTAEDTRYLLRDHLGGVVGFVNGTAIDVDLGFDAWGCREEPGWSATCMSTTSSATFTKITGLTRRGFTGHQQADELELIHMNGRTYDTRLGRFMQADIVVQSPFDTQSYNRYSYLTNNPLNGTDPTGYAVLSAVEDNIIVTASRIDVTSNVSISGLYTIFGGAVSGNYGSYNAGMWAMDSANSVTTEWIAVNPDGANQGVSTEVRVTAKKGGGSRNSKFANGAYTAGFAQAFNGESLLRKWTTKDFLKHYFTGGGKAIDLGSVGLGEDFESALTVRSATSKFIDETMQGPVFNRTHNDVAHTNVTDIGEVDFTGTGALFSVGDGRLNMSATCARGSCSFTFETNDYFIDALDRYDRWQGNQDIPLISNPFPINYRWQEHRSYGQ